MKKAFLYLKFWGPVLAWCGIIFYLSGIPNLSSGLDELSDIILRKGAHIVEYAILTLLLWRALKNTFRGINTNNLYRLTGIFPMIYAISDEIHQGFVPSRGPKVSDVLIDCIGVVIVILLIMRRERVNSPI